MTWRFLRRNSKHTDLDDEIAHDLAAEADENLRSGMSREQAECSSRKNFGNVTLVKESTREAWGWTSLERLLRIPHDEIRVRSGYQSSLAPLHPGQPRGRCRKPRRHPLEVDTAAGARRGPDGRQAKLER